MPDQARAGRWLLACAAALFAAASANAATNSITLDQLAGTWNNAETGDNVKIERAEIGWEAWFSNSGEARITEPPGDGSTVKIDGRDFTCTYTVTITAQTMNWNLTEGEPQAQCLKGSFTRVEPAPVEGKSAGPANPSPQPKQTLPKQTIAKKPAPPQQPTAEKRPPQEEPISGHEPARRQPAPVQKPTRRAEPTPEQKPIRRQQPAAVREATRHRERMMEEKPRRQAMAPAPAPRLTRRQEPVLEGELTPRQRPAARLRTRYRAWRFAATSRRLQLARQYRAYGYYPYWYVVVIPQCGCR